ncbi:MAG: hypothetical protein ACLR6J_12740 [Parabacteroides merdae]
MPDPSKAAYRKLVGWIDHYPGLAVRLAELLASCPVRVPTPPAQVREIVEALWRTATHSFRGAKAAG